MKDDVLSTHKNSIVATNVVETVLKMRTQRLGMIQTEPQYKFAYMAINSAIFKIKSDLTSRSKSEKNPTLIKNDPKKYTYGKIPKNSPYEIIPKDLEINNQQNIHTPSPQQFPPKTTTNPSPPNKDSISSSNQQQHHQQQQQQYPPPQTPKPILNQSQATTRPSISTTQQYPPPQTPPPLLNNSRSPADKLYIQNLIFLNLE